MPSYLANVDWLYVAILAVFALIATAIGNLLSFNHRGAAAVLSAVIFAAIFVAWSYYPHGLPLPTTLAGQIAPAAAPPAPVAPPPAAPEWPRNPVTTISPPPPAR